MITIAGGILLAVFTLVVLIVVGGWLYRKFDDWRFNSNARISHAILEHALAALMWAFPIALVGGGYMLIRWLQTR